MPLATAEVVVEQLNHIQQLRVAPQHLQAPQRVVAVLAWHPGNPVLLYAHPSGIIVIIRPNCTLNSIPEEVK
jgi:hypothetical protein